MSIMHELQRGQVNQDGGLSYHGRRKSETFFCI